MLVVSRSVAATVVVVPLSVVASDDVEASVVDAAVVAAVVVLLPEQAQRPNTSTSTQVSASVDAVLVL
jgi:hypothetical protein